MKNELIDPGNDILLLPDIFPDALEWQILCCVGNRGGCGWNDLFSTFRGGYWFAM
jgi:hypothetical protein